MKDVFWQIPYIFNADQQPARAGPVLLQRHVEKALCPHVRNIGWAGEHDVLNIFRVFIKGLLRGPKREGLFISHHLR